jgi:pimeloyl-ACP methyl ester carboxylesterase
MERAWECASLRVPLDYRAIGRSTIELQLVRTRSADPSRRLGTLLYNPGGPGASGIDNVGAAADRLGDVLDVYDLMTWDPRGVGRSTPVRCDDIEPPRHVPRTEAEWAALDSSAKRLAESCVASSPPMLPYLGLADAARDVEQIRVALGVMQVNYFGVSYGGQLGAAYATVFPDRVGRMVLDSPGSPIRDYRQTLFDQAVGSETALHHFIDHCVAQSNCALGRTHGAAERRFDDFLSQLNRRPIPTVGDQPLTATAAITAMSVGLAAPELWTQLLRALADAMEGEARDLNAFGKLLTDRHRSDGTYSNFTDANTAINCADYPDHYSVSQIRALVPGFAAAAPHFGSTTALRLLECTHWPVHGTGRVRIEARGASQILVIGATGDPMAPYRLVTELVDALGSATLLTHHGVGHGIFGGVDRCIDAHVTAYLRATPLPPTQALCPT